MYPEAGGSSSFARRAFNEFWSFFAAWGQMLNYIITVAISAFFVPHYLGVFWEPLSESPADIVGGIVVVVVLGAVNIVGVKESAGRERLPRARRLPHPGAARGGRDRAGVLDPDMLVDNVDFGTTPTLGDFLIAIPVAMVAYTGIETISNMAEEARDYGKTIPRGIGLVVVAVAVDLRVPARRRAVGDAGGRTARPRSRCPRRRAATPTTRSSAWWRTSTSARSRARPRSTSASSPRRSCSSPPTPG